MEQKNSDASNLSKESSESKDICSNGISILQLNSDCLMHIFSYLPIMDRIELEKVCKHWQIVNKMSWSNVKCLSCKNLSSNRSSLLNFDHTKLNEILSICGSYLTHIEFENSVDRNSKIYLMSRQMKGNMQFFKTLKKWCPKLQSINISSLNVTYEGIDYLTENFGDIKELCLTGFTPNLQSSISYLLKMNFNLQSLSLYSLNYTGVEYLAHLPTELRKFHLYTNHPIGRRDLTPFYHRLQCLHNLRDLSLKYNRIDAETILEMISTNGSLIERLVLNEIDAIIRARDFTDLACLKNLQHLELSGSLELLHEPRILTLELETIMRLPKLRFLKLSNIQVIMNQICHIKNNLQSIIFYKCYQITKEGLLFLLRNANELKTLELTGDWEINCLIDDIKEGRSFVIGKTLTVKSSLRTHRITIETST